MQDREFSIEDGYQILICFLPEFWWNFLKGIMLERGMITDGMTPAEYEMASEEDKIKNKTYRANSLVFDTIPFDQGGCGDYLEEIIEKRMNIPPQKQHERLIVKEDILFQLIIDWCHYFRKKFKGPPNDYSKKSLDFAINWLEDVKTRPEKHKKEWDIWNKIIDDVRKDIHKGANSTFNTHITGMNS